MAAMPRPRLPHLQHERNRHGRLVWYVRIGKGPRVRLRASFGTSQFMAEYRAAVEGRGPPAMATAAEGTLAWAIETYMASAEWAALAGETRKQFGYQFKRMKENSPAAPIRAITAANVIDGRDRRAGKPTDANKFVKASRKLFGWAVKRKLLASNPASDVDLLKLPNAADGFHTWTDEECAAFEARWPLGSRERLAYDIFRFTGLRKSDAVILGRQHVRSGIITIKTQKTGETVTMPLLPELAASIAASPTGDLTFLVTARRTPFDKASFGNWFRKACQAAGVPGSAHGIRKATAAMLAEGGATESQLNAFFGWTEGSKESATYTRKARRSRMAKDAAKLLQLARTSPPGAGGTGNSGSNSIA